jgi:hypothetical protein|tara:strand:+ start:279 stop:620 length:342 start_codon:yes stop_codon:yes gene_type:complete
MNNKTGPLGPTDANLDFSRTEPLETWSGEILWQSGYIIRKVPKEVSGLDQETIVPIQVFYDPKTGRILDNTLPPSIREEITGQTIDTVNFVPNTTSPQKDQSKESEINWGEFN